MTRAAPSSTRYDCPLAFCLTNIDEGKEHCLIKLEEDPEAISAMLEYLYTGDYDSNKGYHISNNVTEVQVVWDRPLPLEMPKREHPLLDECPELGSLCVDAGGMSNSKYMLYPNSC